MTPAEKALKLCQQFGVVGMETEQTQYYSFNLDVSKKLAIIAIDEIIFNEYQFACSHNLHDPKNVYYSKYWGDVRKEVEKLSIP